MIDQHSKLEDHATPVVCVCVCVCVRARARTRADSNFSKWIVHNIDANVNATIEMNPIPASASVSTSKDASIKAVSLKFDAQLSISIIL